jgi:hypothetical protein
MTGRYRFISEHAEAYEVKRLCRVLGVHRSGYTRWADAAVRRAARAAEDQAPAAEIRDAHAASRGSYGVRRIDAEITAAAARGERGEGRGSPPGPPARRVHIEFGCCESPSVLLPEL